MKWTFCSSLGVIAWSPTHSPFKGWQSSIWFPVPAWVWLSCLRVELGPLNGHNHKTAFQSLDVSGIKCQQKIELKRLAFSSVSGFWKRHHTGRRVGPRATELRCLPPNLLKKRKTSSGNKTCVPTLAKLPKCEKKTTNFLQFGQTKIHSTLAMNWIEWQLNWFYLWKVYESNRFTSLEDGWDFGLYFWVKLTDTCYPQLCSSFYLMQQLKCDALVRDNVFNGNSSALRSWDCGVVECGREIWHCEPLTSHAGFPSWVWTPKTKWWIYTRDIFDRFNGNCSRRTAFCVTKNGTTETKDSVVNFTKRFCCGQLSTPCHPGSVPVSTWCDAKITKSSLNLPKNVQMSV